MSLSDNKKEVFGKIAGLRASTKGYLTKTKNSIQGINNGKDSMEFLIDLLKSLEDFNEMKQVIIDTIVFKSKDIEVDFKRTLKKELHNISLCTSNPSIPNSVLSSNPNSVGVNIKLKSLDLLDIFKLDPNSELGKLYFNDVSNGIFSKDFNTFLSNTIQANNGVNSWGSVTDIGQDILDIKFDKFGPINNSINVKISNNYTNDKLSKLNDDYIDSLEILSTDKLINALLDSFSGVISFKANKAKEQLKREEEVNTMIDKIINSDENDVIDNSFFEFKNSDNIKIEELIDRKVNGEFKIDITERIVNGSLDFNEVVDMNNNLSNYTLDNHKATIIDSSLESIGSLTNFEIPSIDLPVVKLNFIEEIVKNLTRVLINLILSPKILIIFILNLALVSTDGFTDIKSFIKNNSTFFKTLINSIKSILIKIILTRVTKKITELVNNKISEIATERYKNAGLQLSSLLGTQIDINSLL